MKRTLLSLLLCALAALAFAQDSLNMIRLARWDDDSLPVASPGNLNLQYNGCWGMALHGHEFAVLGGAAHVLFFDVTQPTAPQLIGKFQGTVTTLVREFKSYKDRIYATSDGGSEGLMIFDMSQAPDTVIRTYWSNEFFQRAHTITLDTLSGRIYLNGTDVDNQGILVLDISENPDQPKLLANTVLPGGYVHDAYVRNDTIYASSGFEGYYVFDFKNPQNPLMLASVSTGGYNHNSWLTIDGRYAFYTEEIPSGRPIHVVDLKNLPEADIEIAHSFLDQLLPDTPQQAIAHNVFIKGSLLFDSQYEDGLLVYDIRDAANPLLIGYYDTHPENMAYHGYFGNWGNYPWLPSGTIIAGDMQNGLQLLRFQRPAGAPAPDCLVYPNPASDYITVQLPPEFAPVWWSYRIFNAAGQLVRTNAVEDRSRRYIPVGHLRNGLYFVEIQTSEGQRAVCRFVVI